VPGIGRLFRKSQRSKAKRNLMVFITPTIVADLNDSEWLTQTKTGESPEAVQRKVEESTTAQRAKTFNPNAPEPTGLEMQEATVK